MRGQRWPEVGVGTDVGGFTVEGVLGTGGCGAVFLARCGGEAFALKLQPLEELGGWAEREVSILQRLKHRHVVRFHACGLWPDPAPRWFYLAMEYVEGRTLQRWVREENPGARAVAELLRDLALGLEALHAVNALHRDVKETNVMVRAATREAVLVDLGVGHYAGAPPLTRGVLPPGTEQYRSPEALAFRRDSAAGASGSYVATAADDLYALGVVLYWMLTDTHPFPGAATPTEVEAVISRAPVAPHERNPRVPRALGALCLRLLAKTPEGRFPSAEALAHAVEALLAGADAGWEVALLESMEEARAVPEPEDAEAGLAAWRAFGEGEQGPPRRGRPEAPRAEAALKRAVAWEDARAARREAAGLPARVVPVRKSPGLPDGRARRWRGAGMALAVGLGVGLSLGFLGVHARGEGPEMAPMMTPPEAVRVAAPPLAAFTPAKEDAPVKTTDTSTPARSRGLARVLATAAACTGLACPGVPVRPDPPGEPCPPGALAAMKQLNIDTGDKAEATFDLAMARSPEIITVREGWVRLRITDDMGDLPQQTVVSGRLYLGQYVYGRFTEAQTKSGQRFPVCLEMREPGEKRGARRREESDGDSARIGSEQYVQAVRRFE